MIVTSRDRLSGLVAQDGAQRLALDVLTVDEAHSLLARLLSPERVHAEPDAVEALIRSCGCLPLALRIAAAALTCGWTSTSRPAGVQNFDVLDFDPGPLDWIIAISTLEHVGWDEEPVIRARPCAPWTISAASSYRADGCS